MKKPLPDLRCARDFYSNDPRIAIMDVDMSDIDDWFRGAHGGIDVWWHAENVVFARKHYSDIMDHIELREYEENSTHMVPFLPPELERKIFEMAFDPEDPSENVQMMLVSKRVRIWIRPLVYRIMEQRTRRFPDFVRRPMCVDVEEICQFVQHLAIDRRYCLYTLDMVKLLIKRCPNLISLGYWSSEEGSIPWYCISTLHQLRRLSVNLARCTNVGAGFDSPAFSSITHLEFLSTKPGIPLGRLIAFTNITHFSISSMTNTDNAWFRTLGNLLSSWDSLRVFVVVELNERLKDYVKYFYAQDTRIAIVDDDMNDVSDWFRGARGERDLWWHAENMVLARKRGYFASDTYLERPMGADFPWVEYLTQEGLAWYRAQVVN
ncbi:hypothetical protein CVT24_002222 [Panaeolus cyanescens]|uniref:Uncharacterized protein n=1 Tax=Panaeolus cyanescens TaxID=181874 RepID=A0A409YIH5_9AGAR|nr:hypothetical protein CVT24_002222 [Panaeolus cyanescens]